MYECLPHGKKFNQMCKYHPFFTYGAASGPKPVTENNGQPLCSKYKRLWLLNVEGLSGSADYIHAIVAYCMPQWDVWERKVQQVQELINKEAAKNYSAAQIFRAMRGVVTEAGTLLLDTAGGTFTKM